MFFQSFDENAKLILNGNLLMIVCSACYLAWWAVAFIPDAPAGGIKTIVLFAAAAITGVVSVLMLLRGINAVPHGAELVSGKYLIIAGAIIYIILLAATWLVLKRPVTTELLLIVAWSVLEVSAISALYGLSMLGRGGSFALVAVVLAAAVVSMVCYLMYYNMGGMQGYIDGMVPLMTVAAAMGIITAAAVI